jgi:ABC-2 type transport system permease protein
MNKIPLIIKREYLIRVKKKSFIIMTIVGPVLMAALFVAPIWFASMNDTKKKEIEVYDKTGKYLEAFESTETLSFVFVNDADDQIRKDAFLKSGHHALLTINDTLSNEFDLYSGKSPDLSVKEQISSMLKRYIEQENLRKLGINKEDIDSAMPEITINTYTITEEGEKASSAELTVAIGFIAAIFIYIFIFMYGTQVMRGVIEEKVNRVVEVLISSVRPFQLMAGKIIGIALVALTQFLLWIVLTGILVGFIYLIFGAGMMQDPALLSQGQNLTPETMQQLTSNSQLGQIMTVLFNFNWTAMLITFVFFFIGGYLLYASLFAAIGAAVDNETDTQQFMLPVTIPLILAFVAAQGIIQNPDGPMAFWLSIIPFTSPVIMPVRVAMERYELWELILSIGLLIATFVGTVWMAAKIYRTGILMYGKKVSYKELWKWIRYKS